MQYKQNISLIYNIINYILIKFSTINICNKILLHILYSKYYCTQVVSARSWEGGHWWVCLPMPLVYVVFSLIYWAAGGTNEVGIWVILYYLNYSLFQKINEIVDRFTQMCCVVTTAGTASICYWEKLMLLKRELMLLKCQISTNTNKNGFLLPTKCLECVLKYSFII